MSNKDVKGKLRKILSQECPDCEEENLQLRDLDNYSIIICPGCGYEEESEALNKSHIRKLREAKNGEIKETEVQQKQTRTYSPDKPKFRGNF